jgi:hypothetical protein
MKKNGYRYCKLCGNKLKKKGFTSQGKQRWCCKKCNKSFIFERSDLKARYRSLRFKKWIISTKTQNELTEASRTFRLHSSNEWKQHIVIPETGEVHKIILIDGIRIDDECCLIARTPDFVIGWLWCSYESSQSWSDLLVKFPPPKYIVCDGQNGMQLSISKIYRNTSVQRCLFHVMKNIRSKLTMHPKTEAGIVLYGIARDLMRVNDEMGSRWWTTNLMEWHKKYVSFIDEKTYLDLTTYEKYQRKWWYTHKNLRSAYKQLISLLQDDYLFTFLKHPEDNVPSTTNYMEGGINSQLRTLLKAHRGMKKEHQKKLVEEYLYSRSEFDTRKVQ